MATKIKKAEQDQEQGGNGTAITIPPPNFGTAKFRIVGTAPLVQNAFPTKAREQMKAKQAAGSQAKKGGKKDPKDFQQCYEQSQHISREGWNGIPCGAFRSALVSACRTVDFKMTIAKLSLFVVADGFDRVDGTPLVKIAEGEPHYVEHAVRNESGVADIRPRAMWDHWECVLTVRWDADKFRAADVANLLHRAGLQVGVQEGRPDSKKSTGMGWGTFRIAE
jgi:hypothetical protein